MGQPAQKKPKTERTLLFEPWYLHEGNPDKIWDEASYEELSFEASYEELSFESKASYEELFNKALSQGSQPKFDVHANVGIKEKEREKELRQEAERDAHIANYRADLDDWMQLLMM